MMKKGWKDCKNWMWWVTLTLFSAHSRRDTYMSSLWQHMQYLHKPKLDKTLAWRGVGGHEFIAPAEELLASNSCWERVSFLLRVWPWQANYSQEHSSKAKELGAERWGERAHKVGGTRSCIRILGGGSMIKCILWKCQLKWLFTKII